MAALLPDDLLHMICGELWARRDFDTLYQCARAGKQLAVPALASIYRMHDKAPITTAGGDGVETSVHEKPTKTTYETTRMGQERAISKWVSMWRSIILSSLKKTLFPYSQYIRTLDFGDLESLLGDVNFTGKIRTMFQMGEVGNYLKETEVQIRKSNFFRIDTIATVNNLAEVVTRHTPMVEELSGNFHPQVMAECLSRMPRLQNLTVWSGEALEGNGRLVHENCHVFKALRFYGWQHPEADSHLATFLSDIRPQTLELLEIISTSQIGAGSFLALNNHCDSLTELTLDSIQPEAIPALSTLKECINLTNLVLAENGIGTVDLVEKHNESFLEIVAWLRQCTKLRNITVARLLSATAILTPILLEHNIQLTHLELEGYVMSQSKEFHHALVHQPSLQFLRLKGESSLSSSDADVLVESLSKLENLTDLRLHDISDYFMDEHIRTLAKSLHKLEIWASSGYAITDAIWGDVGSLRYLRSLYFSAMTRFTANGIMDFILNLGPGNKDLILSVTMADPDSDLSEEEKSMITETINSKVEGRFEFMLSREPDASTSFGSDSD